MPFAFPGPPKAFASPLIRLEGAAVGYIEDQPVLQGLDLRLDADDRVRLLGANGNGKSTFAKLIAGRLAPMQGRRYGSDKIAVGYFAQHQMDDLPAAKGWQLLPGNVKWRRIKGNGTGQHPTVYNNVRIHYEGKLTTGKPTTRGLLVAVTLYESLLNILNS